MGISANKTNKSTGQAEEVKAPQAICWPSARYYFFLGGGMKTRSGASAKRMAIRNAMKYLAFKNKRYGLYYADGNFGKRLILEDKTERVGWILSKEAFGEFNIFAKDNMIRKMYF